jgi:hypothetical protein
MQDELITCHHILSIFYPTPQFFEIRCENIWFDFLLQLCSIKGLLWKVLAPQVLESYYNIPILVFFGLLVMNNVESHLCSTCVYIHR